MLLQIKKWFKKLSMAERTCLVMGLLFLVSLIPLLIQPGRERTLPSF